jgi:hypothetical protein
MNDAGLVRGFDRFGNLPRQGQRLVERDRTARDARAEILALDQFHHQRAGAGRRGARRRGVLEPVDAGDVGMVERGERARLALESHQPIGIVRERLRQDLERDIAPEPGVAGAIDLAHAAGANDGDDLVRPDARARGECHAGR